MYIKFNADAHVTIVRTNFLIILYKFTYLIYYYDTNNLGYK